MKFKELLDVVDNGKEIKTVINVYGARFIAVYNKNTYRNNCHILLDKDVQKIEASDDELTITLN